MSDNNKHTGSRRKTVIPRRIMKEFFIPRRLAIIGVSAEENGVGFGTGMFRAITAMGFEGKIFPVNPKGGTISGLEIYKRVEDIPGKIDFAVIAVTARHVPDALEACLQNRRAPARRFSLPALANWELQKEKNWNAKLRK